MARNLTVRPSDAPAFDRSMIQLTADQFVAAGRRTRRSERYMQRVFDNVQTFSVGMDMLIIGGLH